MDIPNTSKDVPWFKPDITELDPAFRRIMEEYSKIPSNEVKSHILAVVSCPERLVDSVRRRLK